MTFFESADHPRLFAMPPGRDFAADFVAGLRQRLDGHSPETAARILVFLSTKRLREGIRREFASGPPGFLPRLRLITELARDPSFPDLPPAVDPLRRRLELAQAVGKLLEGDDRFASRTAIHDLADSLAGLLDEMHAEGVSPEMIKALDVSEHSEHWARSLRFIDIINDYWSLNDQPDTQARQRLVVERLVASWESSPPSHPVIVAGSTGSKGATLLLMEAVANLPQGAVVVPCFDFELPKEAWGSMADSATGEDHAQFRLKRLMERLGVDAEGVDSWFGGDSRGVPRNRLISLALRPAPVTDQWMTEGPRLRDIPDATEGLALVEAADDRQEAVAIALCLREAVENGETASLVTPDKKLARAVSAALKRWGLVPFDSFGSVLLQTVPGRLLHAIADLLGSIPEPVQLIALLRHSLVHSAENRPLHLKMTEIVENDLRNRELDASLLTTLNRRREKMESNAEADGWFNWLIDCLDQIAGASSGSLTEYAELHDELTCRLLGGSKADAVGLSRSDPACRAALEIFEQIRSAADAAGRFGCEDYAYLFKSLAARKSIWMTYSAHPLISIWDTIDARMQSPDLVVAAGLNEGVWPAQPSPDPWLNRQLRKEAGLLLPERITGLRAHDFQQAVSARRVVLSRSIRSSDAATVSSRWLARLIGLLSGLKCDGVQALENMRVRGREILDRARQMEEPRELLAPERRPEPRPPVEARPRRLSVTQIKTLITNPYEIYAKQTLRLRELNPLGSADLHSQRGTLIHKVLELFVNETRDDNSACTPEKLMEIAEQQFAFAELPNYAKRFWKAQLNNIASEFVDEELERRRRFGSPWILEGKGSYYIADIDFELTARADRIDRSGNHRFLYDYKTGSIPTKKAIERFDKQIPLTAIMIEKGGLGEAEGAAVARSAYIGVGRELKTQDVGRGDKDTDLFASEWIKLQAMLRDYLKESTPFTARRDVRFYGYGNAYHHLARFGEWDDASGLGGSVKQ